ncbi:phosphatidylinositol-specific phospholipase C/glycerophosphodiester phosphodiesterase family protein [Paenibacillus pinistramenti]|uniref:phosphatidylinositol-specific phospholipase C/glycerophosphodiester phosphodiesterase family protein n=1 Tax=Paenibacillus pinistramenti TaxID=1768003 RepID=UPI001109EFC9|nr:phosphatidylinositol-specific phospholipase C/glycerophosphodiester phosphodiesterase family protein [Paenibacillus pinistramenti]
MKRLLSLLGVAAAVFLIMLFGSSFIFHDQESAFDKKGFLQYQAVSHAMGAINGLTYTNSYEAFISSYAKGNRVFEMDMLFTSDEDPQLIGRHEWGASLSKMMGQQGELPEDRLDARFTYEEFRQAKIQGKYDALSWADAVQLLHEYPDIYIITDTKEIEPERINQMFSTIVKEADEVDPSVLSRVVPQIYNQPMLAEVKAVYDFPQIIYTLYVSKDTDAQVVKFVRENHITAVTMSDYRANRWLISALTNLGVPSYVHTIDTMEDVLKYKAMGAYGFYSDDLSESDLQTPAWKVLLGLR